jgi:prepilin-type N-terminal cleavage/methylation domain-containing protein
MPGRRGRKPALRSLENESGFSLVELLVVLIIIGILASISIAAFTKQQNKAHDADAKAAARSAQTAMETYFVDHKSYAGADRAELEQLQPSLRDAPGLAVKSASSNQYEVETTSTSTQAVIFNIKRLPSGTVSRTCSPASTGSCGSGATW